MTRRTALALIALAVWVPRAGAAERLDFQVRGKTLTAWVYRPAGPPKGTVIMSSGDVGWVGLAADMASFLSSRGFIVVGVNVRQYLSSFTVGRTHLAVSDPPADYQALADLLRRENLLHEPVVVSGVSEGAALAVLVASSARNHAWLRGVVTMGVPPNAELAWRWTDFPAWITKSDAHEPSFAARDFVAAVSPLPLVMIQSKKDEYVTEADYTALEQAAKSPKKLILIDASNHRFTDRRGDLEREYIAALAWIQGFKPPPG
jgi:alpha-beta hydrolase superfamily lysophospholipase